MYVVGLQGFVMIAFLTLDNFVRKMFLDLLSQIATSWVIFNNEKYHVVGLPQNCKQGKFIGQLCKIRSSFG